MTITAFPSATAKRQVVVTGCGAVTPLGCTMAETWAGVAAGRPAAARIRRFDASGFATQIACEVAGFSLDARRLQAQELAALSPTAAFGCQAALEALAQAGLLDRPAARPERTAVCLGVGMSSPELTWYLDAFLPKRFAAASIAEYGRHVPGTLATVIARLAHAGGGCTTIHTACASSGQALGEAYEKVAYDEADVVLAGGADSMINPLYLSGFSLLGALSTRNDDPKAASRPFDADRDGFVMGEGAGMLVFEELGHARGRGAAVLGEVCGYGVTASAYRVTDLHPGGRGPKEAMEQALADAGIAPAQVGYLNAHGTSTPLNDRLEAACIRQVFDPARCRVRVSSTKSMTGHLIAAAGAVEFAITLEALRRQLLPPTINVFRTDRECPIELTAPEAQARACEYALSNSVGFGGSNTALVARRCAR